MCLSPPSSHVTICTSLSSFHTMRPNSPVAMTFGPSHSVMHAGKLSWSVLPLMARPTAQQPCVLWRKPTRPLCTLVNFTPFILEPIWHPCERSAVLVCLLVGVCVCVCERWVEEALRERSSWLGHGSGSVNPAEGLPWSSTHLTCRLLPRWVEQTLWEPGSPLWVV